MSTPRLTELAEKAILGSNYIVSDYVASPDFDIATPKQIMITTLAAHKCQITMRIKCLTAAVILIKKTVVLGTGGSMSAGTALTPYGRDLANTTTPNTTFAKDYVLGSSGQSAGTTVLTEYALPGIEAVIKLKLDAGVKYGLICTSVADNNGATYVFDFDEA
jgi:hypothetical protein